MNIPLGKWSTLKIGGRIYAAYGHYIFQLLRPGWPHGYLAFYEPARSEIDFGSAFRLKNNRHIFELRFWRFNLVLFKHEDPEVTAAMYRYLEDIR